MRWQSIETAKEFTDPIIVKGFYDFDHKEEMLAVAAILFKKVWWRDNNGYGFTVRCYPTHWIQMPE